MSNRVGNPFLMVSDFKIIRKINELEIPFSAEQVLSALHDIKDRWFTSTFLQSYLDFVRLDGIDFLLGLLEFLI